MALFVISLIVYITLEGLYPSRIIHLRIASALHQLDALKRPLELYKADNGVFPSNSEGLEGLLPTENHIGYLRKMPVDPWGNLLIYRSSGGVYELYSIGFNGIDENTLGDDVTDRNKEYSCEVYGANCLEDWHWYFKRGALITLLFSSVTTLLALMFIALRHVYRGLLSG